MSSTPRLDTPVPGMEVFLRVAVAVAFVLAIVGALASGSVGRVAAGGAVGVIVAVPLLRVSALGVHWLRQRDRGFAFAALGLMLVVGCGALIAGW